MPKPKARRPYTPGPHIFRRDNGIWYAYFSPTEIRSLRTRDESEARRRFRDLAARPGRSAADVERVAASEASLVEIAHAFLEAPHGYTRRTKQSARNRIAAFGDWMEAHGVKYPSQIADGHIDAWMRDRMAGTSRATVNRDLRMARTVLRWAATRGMAAPCPPLERKGLREPRRDERRTVPDPAEWRRIFAAMDKRGRHFALAACRAQLACGCRIDELRRLADTDLRGTAVHIRPESGPADEAEPTKGYRERVVPLSDGAAKAVRAFLALRSKGGWGTACSESWLNRRLLEACKAAGVPKATTHDLRRAFVTEAFRGGADLVQIGRWAGHKLVATTERYVSQYRSDAAAVAPPSPALSISVDLGSPRQSKGVHSRQPGTARKRGKS